MPSESVTKTPVRKIDMRGAYSNQMRFSEEVARGVHGLLEEDRRSRAWLAKRLGVSAAYISKILGEGPQNFTLSKLADLSYAFGRSVHLVFADNPDGMRMPVDEVAEARKAEANTTATKASFPIDQYRDRLTFGTRAVVTTSSEAVGA